MNRLAVREKCISSYYSWKSRLNTGIEKILNFCFENERFKFVMLIIVLLLIDCGMLFFNEWTPLICDDYVYAYKHNMFTDRGAYDIISASGRVASLGDIFESQYMHYFAWGGRSVVHSIAQFFLMYDKTVFNIANTAAYILLLAVICAHIRGKNKWNPGWIIVLNAALFAFTPAFGQDFLWLTGACNYLWGGLLSFSYLLAFRFQMEQEAPVIRRLFPCILYGLCGIICAWTNENIAVTMVVLSLLFNGYTYFRRGKCYRWSIFATIGIIIGATMMIGAPGNYMRLEYETLDNVPSSYMERLAIITFYFFDQNSLLLPMAFVLLCYIMSKKGNIDLPFLFYAIGLIVSMYSMVAAPYYAGRARLGSLLFALVMAGRLFSTININKMQYRKIWSLVVIVAISSTGMNFIEGGHAIIEYNDVYRARMEIISQAKAEGNLDPVLPGEVSQTKFCGALGLFRLKMNPDSTWNKAFAKYYGLHSVRLDTDIVRDVSMHSDED